MKNPASKKYRSRKSLLARIKRLNGDNGRLREISKYRDIGDRLRAHRTVPYDLWSKIQQLERAEKFNEAFELLPKAVQADYGTASLYATFKKAEANGRVSLRGPEVIL